MNDHIHLNTAPCVSVPICALYKNKEAGVGEFKKQQHNFDVLISDKNVLT